MRKKETSVETQLKPAWAIISASMGRGTEWGWVSNDGSNGPVLTQTQFKKRAQAASDYLANKHWYENLGGRVVKIHTNKERFIKDYKEKTGNEPNLN